MSREKRITASKKQVNEGIVKINSKAPVCSDAEYQLSRVNFFKLLVVEEKLDDISERMKLIETALGLIAQGKSA